jgi:NitT/TauT family transport system permease protein
MALMRVIPRRIGWSDLVGLALVGLLVYGLVRMGAEWRAPAGSTVVIDLSLRALPLYTFFSLCRGLLAFGISLAFTLVYGWIAARVRHADKVMVPVLDILQSIPVLGFMPGVVLALAALFPSSRIGLELAAIVMIFTGQVWNMTFSFYHSLRAVPGDLLDAGRVYRFDWWRRFRRIELPYATVGLVWNGMMSMAGGWFFLTVAEAFRLGDRDFRLPGVGAYMSVAIDRGDRTAMAGAVVAVIVMIVVLDQFLWRPLVAWSEKFKFEDTASATVAGSWVLDLVRGTRIYVWGRDFAAGMRERWRMRRMRRRAKEPAPARATPRSFGTAATVLVLGAFAAICVLAGLRLGALLGTLPRDAWISIARASGLTLGRTTAAVALGTIWTVPVGVYIGTHPRASRILQPVVQVAASFPAPMLFPLVLLLLARAHLGLGAGAILLMMLGTQWYILFNVIAGAMSIPEELHQAARVYRFTPWQRWRLLLLPGIFPSLVTGWVTAAGGAWNASIVSEYLHAGGEVRTTEGLGALISTAADAADFPRLAAGVLAMAFIVVAVNRIVWKQLYRLAERRYALG